jgi:hypothetical protein
VIDGIEGLLNLSARNWQKLCVFCVRLEVHAASFITLVGGTRLAGLGGAAIGTRRYSDAMTADVACKSMHRLTGRVATEAARDGVQ